MAPLRNRKKELFETMLVNLPLCSVRKPWKTHWQAKTIFIASISTNGIKWLPALVVKTTLLVAKHDNWNHHSRVESNIYQNQKRGVMFRKNFMFDLGLSTEVHLFVLCFFFGGGGQPNRFMALGLLHQPFSLLQPMWASP